MECEICGRVSEEGFEIVTDKHGMKLCRGCKSEMDTFDVYDEALSSGVSLYAEMNVWYDDDFEAEHPDFVPGVAAYMDDDGEWVEVDTDTSWEECSVDKLKDK